MSLTPALSAAAIKSRDVHHGYRYREVIKPGLDSGLDSGMHAN